MVGPIHLVIILFRVYPEIVDHVFAEVRVFFLSRVLIFLRFFFFQQVVSVHRYCRVDYHDHKSHNATVQPTRTLESGENCFYRTLVFSLGAENFPVIGEF